MIFYISKPCASCPHLIIGAFAPVLPERPARSLASSIFGQNWYIRINFGDMNTLIIDNKSYVVVPAESYQALQKKAALKSRPEKTLSIKEARAHSKKLIRKWATGK